MEPGLSGVIRKAEILRNILLDAALREISSHRGRLYDERVVAACLKIFADGYDLPIA